MSPKESDGTAKKTKSGLGWMEWLRGWLSIIGEMLFQRISASHLQSPMPLPPVNDITCIITGCTSGIGLETARQLAESGAHVVMAVRKPKAAEELIQKWQAEWSGIGLPLNIEVMELDLLSLESVVRFSEAWNSRMGPLHVLINNAGIFSIGEPQKFSKDEYEQHMQVNHLAPALLSILLLPSLIRGSPSRIINVNSIMHTVGFVDPEDMNVVSGKRKYTSLVGYAGSKLAQVMFSSNLQKRLPAEAGVNVLCANPGIVQTNVARDLPGLVQTGYHLIPYFIFSPQEGARSSLFAATDPQIPEYCDLLRSDEWPTCAFISPDCRPANPAEEAHDLETSNRVWEKTLELIGLPSDAVERLIEGEEVNCRYGSQPPSITKLQSVVSGDHFFLGFKGKAVQQMASVTASHFLSRTSHVGSVSESKASLIQTDLNKGYSGLRPLSQVHNFQLKSNAKALSKLRCKAPKAQNHKATCPIVCGMSAVFISAEVAPWSKTGGLGDVVGGLPAALAAMGHRVMTIAPRYDQYKDGWDTNVLVQIQVGDKVETVRFFHCYKRGVDRVFVDHPMFLEKVWGKTKSKIYGPTTGTDYDDNQLRFSLLCLAALEAPRVLNLNNNKYHSGPYGEDVVFIANDWHTALVPCYLKSVYQSRGIYKNAKVAFCIHNIAYQGRFAFSDYSMLNLPSELKGSFDFIDGYIEPVKGRKINWMKAGILESDRVVTVSPHYAKELVSGVAKGVELDHILRLTSITGIVNGMDVQEWNPVTDKHIDVHYDHTTVHEAKALLKEALQAEVGLPVDRNIPLIGFIGRLEEQKGSDILAAAIPHFIKENVQIVVLGTGKKYLERQLEELEVKYPDKARGIAKFNVSLAHMITAGADFMLVPSRFEPCGLIQLHAMQYGTVPIVSCTGGLVDTVKEGYTGFQMGSFSVECKTIKPADVLSLAITVKRALLAYGTPALKEMIQNCMAQDLSWKGPAKLWEKMLLGMEVIGELGTEEEEVAPLSKENVPTP